VAVSSAQAAPPRAERAPSGSPEGVLALADGVELIGEFEGSGYRRPPLLARRGDGQMVQLTRLLYLVAEACDGRRDAQAVADAVSACDGRRVSAANVLHLAEEQLRPLGVLTQPDGTTPELPKRLGLLSLRHRRPVLPARAVNVLAVLFEWLHVAPIKAALLGAVMVFDAWLFFFHGIAGGIRDVLYEPAWLLAVLVSVVVATLFHEVGHASACRYSGARPGVLGVGVYLIWPAFYCDVTDAYRLHRRGRMRTDLGGVYFNLLFALGCGVAYFLTGHEALLFGAFVQHMIVFQQLLPLLRFDGYYVLSDLTGVPDILSRVKPIFRSLVRGRRREPKVAELKSWVRIAVTAYLIVLIPALGFMIGSIVLSAPRTFATAYDSFGLQLDRFEGADGFAEMGVGAFRIAALVMPLAAMSLSVTRSARMGVRGIGRWSRGSVLRRAVAGTGLAAFAGAIAFVWWPNGDYQPIRPGERGTIPEVVRAIPAIPSGRPSFTPERAAEFASVPTVRERGGLPQTRPDADGPLTVPLPDLTEEPGPGDDGYGDEGSGGDDPAIGTDPSLGQTPTGSGSTPGATSPPPAGGTAPADGSAPSGEPAPSGTTQPDPTSTATPSPSATATPAPTQTETPTPGATGMSTPDATSDATQEATAIADPSPTATPDTQPLEASPTPLPTP
jgi:putative peptide zinc metalloprotease protein